MRSDLRRIGWMMAITSDSRASAVSPRSQSIATPE
jgi:hypothetical protein